MSESSKPNLNKDQYTHTLQLPKTPFPMKANLPEREALQVQKWNQENIYSQMLSKNLAGPKFLLHDGPPYANGSIHLGHALNKVLKDVVIKYKNMTGYYAPFVPGWDCHGLPIELGVEKQLIEQKKDKSSVSTLELRKHCREYAQKYIDIQSEQFQRLEIFGEWNNPYLTMSREYVSSIVAELGRCAETGALYQGNKPVYWCTSCRTALAEAEIEYQEKTSPSIYVKFDLTSESLKKFGDLDHIAKREGAIRTSVIIWTTTPWTLPANLAVSLHPDFEYVVIKVPSIEGTELWIVAKGRQEEFEKAAGFEVTSEPLLKFKAEKLHRLELKHPLLLDKISLIILGDHVTLEAGTGAVHTAPGHGIDDYKIGCKYGLPIFAPVDAKGLYTDEYPDMKGQFIFKANAPIIQKLSDQGLLVTKTDIKHSYPHCWRCHQAVIFRATPQWFIGMDNQNLRKNCERAIYEVKWIPDWGINRILGMIESRPDWCISRQRIWGVPITVFYCEKCETPLADAGVFRHVSELIKQNGPDYWFEADVEKLLPPGSSCSKCQSKQFRKEKDILDVWFDSGVSHIAVCKSRGLGWPADLYLEGSDQHRGWFQTSLLTGVATCGKAPFKAVLTHGFINDKEGKKMSKSKGNVTSPLDLMKTHGAEIVRLWVMLEDYRNDLSFSVESLDRVSDSYRKIRNTVRFLLGNLSDFNPDQDLVSINRLGQLDRFALSSAALSFLKIKEAYDKYEFHTVYHALVNFCNVEMSALYFDILKDRLYTAGKNSAERKSSQTVLWLIGDSFTRILAPILSFTAEEIWALFPKKTGTQASIFLNNMPETETGLSTWIDSESQAIWAPIWVLRDIVLKSLEEARREKIIGHPREAKVFLSLDSESLQATKKIKEDLSRIFLVSALELSVGREISARIEKAPGTKCERCWTYTEEVGKNAAHPQICFRCVEAIEL